MKELHLRPQFCTERLQYTGPGTTRVNEMNFGMKHAPGAGLIAQPDDPQPSVPPLARAAPISYHTSLITHKDSAKFPTLIRFDFLEQNPSTCDSGFTKM